MHVLRCLDSESGVSMVLRNEYSRRRIKELYKASPDLFKIKFNEGQCFYFSEDIEKTDIWCKDQIKIFREMSHYVTESSFVKYLFYLDIREELLEVNSQLRFPIVPIYEEDEELEDVIDRIMFFHALVLAEYKIQINYPQRIRQVPVDYYFEDEQFIIREPKDLEEILVESLTQHNCLYEYPIHEKESIILFLRSKKRGIDVPYVDVEIKANQLIQMKTKYNREVSPGVREFVRNYCVRKKIEFCF